MSLGPAHEAPREDSEVHGFLGAHGGLLEGVSLGLQVSLHPSFEILCSSIQLSASSAEELSLVKGSFSRDRGPAGWQCPVPTPGGRRRLQLQFPCWPGWLCAGWAGPTLTGELGPFLPPSLPSVSALARVGAWGG